MVLDNILVIYLLAKSLHSGHFSKQNKKPEHNWEIENLAALQGKHVDILADLNADAV